MSALEMRSAPATDAIFEAVANLNDEDFKSVLIRLLMLNTQKQTLSPKNGAAELLQVIRQKPTSAFKREYCALKRKRDEETLTPDEHERLIELSTQLEQQNVLRYAALDALAKMRGVSWDALIEELQMKPLMP